MNKRKCRRRRIRGKAEGEWGKVGEGVRGKVEKGEGEWVRVNVGGEGE